MGRLSKDDYFRRELNAERRNLKNYEIAVDNGMSEKEADNIVALCSLRHELHTSMDSVVTSINDNKPLIDGLLDVIEDLKQSDDPIKIHMGLCEGCPDDMETVLEIPEEYGAPYSRDDKRYDDWVQTKDYHNWYAGVYEELYEEWSLIHEEIEDYLRSIDKKYHTQFCPTGALRIYI